MRRGKGYLLEYRRRRARDPAEAVGRVGVVVTFSPRLRVVSHKGGQLVLRGGADGRGVTPPSTPTPLVAHTAIEFLTITHYYAPSGAK